MNMTEDIQTNGSGCERKLVEILRQRGPQMLDTLCELPEFNWAQVLMAVDHLSRSREVALELVAPREYQVSLSGVRA